MAGQEIYQEDDFVSDLGAPLCQLPVRLQQSLLSPRVLELTFVYGFPHMMMMSLPPLAEVEQLLQPRPLLDYS